MLHPSYLEIMNEVNKDVAEGEDLIVQSRYSIVKATANRAKEIIDARFLEEKYSKMRDNSDKEVYVDKEDKRKMAIGEELVAGGIKQKPLSIAVQEIYQGKVKILPKTDAE